MNGQLQLFDLAGRHVRVIGLGESGLAMARWAQFRGATVSVADSREAPPRLVELRRELPAASFLGGPLAALDLAGVDLLAWSPGLSIELGDGALLARAAAARGVPVAGEIELFAQALAELREQGYAPQVAAITGTNGKTTTTRLVGHLAAQAGLRVAVAGNIAPAALDALREALIACGEAPDPGQLPQLWVLELSSFQLALADSLAPDVAAILNLSQDHLDWHGSMASYVAAKQRIWRGARACVWNRDDALTEPPAGAAARSSFGATAPQVAGDVGIVHEGGLRWLARAVPSDDLSGSPRRRRETSPPVVKRLMPADALRIRGAHNHGNALAALAISAALGLPLARLLHGLRDFAGEPHRCQLVAVLDDVEYVDDSKGTNVGATVAALTGLGKRCLLIAGGDGKGQDFAPLADAVRAHARAVFLIGRDAPLLQAVLADTGVPLHPCASLEAAVGQARALARVGDAVLLSPACASWDMFRDYAHRAEVFVAAVRALAEEAGQPC
jgi:UDP-N-acetylmuramoylalanine--D-glutamate ligase